MPEKSKFDKQRAKKKDGEKKKTDQSALIQYGGVQIRRGGHENCVDGTAARVRLSICPNQIISNAGETASYLPSPQPQQTFLCRPPRSLREQAALPLLETKRGGGGWGGGTVMLVSLQIKGDRTCLVSAARHVFTPQQLCGPRGQRPIVLSCLPDVRTVATFS